MTYFDLHCDALTQTGRLQASKHNLEAGKCALQCFAAFISARENRYRIALDLCNLFEERCASEGYHPVLRAKDLQYNAINALLTVEEGGAIEGDIKKLGTLYRKGVRMMTLTWNYPNEIGYPNFPDYEGMKSGRTALTVRETERGLTQFGAEVVETMNGLGMIVDVSHGSDKLFSDVSEICKKNGKPFVASHSCANTVQNCARNLSDAQIKTLADCGGVIGLNFCADFLSDNQSAEGQRAAILAHARHIVNTGGENVLAIGSDFDGIPENPYLKNPSDMPKFLELMTAEFGSFITEKIARTNFLRVFEEVCG